QSGTQTRPDIFDDGCLCEQPLKKVKAFTDVGNIESMSKERWGAAKWVRGQARTYCSSDFDIKTVSHSDFLKMLESAWCSKDCNDANIMAVLQRTHIFVNTAKCLYIRPASETEGPVLRIPLGDKIDFLHVDSRKVYDYHRKGGQDAPQDFEMKVNWERDWVAKAMGGEVNLPTRATIIRRGGLFQSAPSESADSTVKTIVVSRNSWRNTSTSTSLPQPLSLTSRMKCRPSESWRFLRVILSIASGLIRDVLFTLFA
ncbi:unnamed protein product, partial [Symbiodinium necroappetens]